MTPADPCAGRHPCRRPQLAGRHDLLNSIFVMQKVVSVEHVEGEDDENGDGQPGATELEV